MSIHQESSHAIPGVSRRATPEYRQSRAQAENFKGLPEGMTRFDLLRLVKDAGSAAGLTPPMVQLLEYYLLFTQDQDWEYGSNPICYQSVQKTAFALNCTERTVQRTERALHAAGALTWNDSGNHKRYGQRDRGGQIMYACGVDLSPLVDLIPDLEKAISRRKEYAEQWQHLKKQISAMRGQIRGLLEAAAQYPALDQVREESEVNYEGIAMQIRTNKDLGDLRTLLTAHKDLYAVLKLAVMRSENNALDAQIWAEQQGIVSDEVNSMSLTSDNSVAHKHSTNHSSIDKSNSSEPLSNAYDIKGVENQARIPKSEGPLSMQEARLKVEQDVAAIKIGNLLSIITPEMLYSLNLRPEKSVSWTDITNGAHSMLQHLGINQTAWVEATQWMGLTGAAMAVIITDAKTKSGEVMKPGGYIRGMTEKAKGGELKLHDSIFGLMDRKNGQTDA